MRAVVIAALLCAGATAAAQTVTVSGQVVLKEDGQPLGFTTVSVLSQGTQLLTSESGRFLLTNLPPGEVRLRFKRIGFSPRDTTLTVAANDTARLSVQMTRIVIPLPAMLVSGQCTNETPSQPQPKILADLFEQVHQNAERALILLKQKPFVLHVYRVQAIRRGNTLTPGSAATETRSVEYRPYVAGKIVTSEAGSPVFHLPDLANFADTAFTNHHCFRYAGQGRWEADSVIRVEFEPVPWLEKQGDIVGTIYLRAADYQLVGSTIRFNRIPRPLWGTGLEALEVHARYGEIVSGIPTLDEWVLTRKLRQYTRVETGQVFRLEWLDSTKAKVDTVRHRR